VAVLDEADEMLDLGFREDLEFILNAAPQERRTLRPGTKRKPCRVRAAVSLVTESRQQKPDNGRQPQCGCAAHIHVCS
jgi:hypothetical protein